MRRIVVTGAVLAACLTGCGPCSVTVGGSDPCDVLALPYKALKEEGQTFEGLVGQTEFTEQSAASAALVLLLRGDVDLGPYEPAIDFLVDRDLAWNPDTAEEHRRMPARTAEVIASARRLDRDLADGLCD